MKPDLTTIAITLILPCSVLFAIFWRTTTLRIKNRRKALFNEIKRRQMRDQ